MQLHKIARRMLAITAVAWGVPVGVPLALAEDPKAPQDINPRFEQLDVNRDGFVSRDELRNFEGYHKYLAAADVNRDGKLDAAEFAGFQTQQDRAYVARVAADTAITTKVKTALLRERNLDSLDVSVETYKGTVLLSGFVKNDAQRRKAIQLAGSVDGVAGVKDGLAVAR